ncbi:hypothetical protein EYF80_065677 [Liparis tanakae]|uniref:Uncharacterized protein n=1 Tax=Liparis tanakae TaxID=230148 RepID=A0A4Z2E6I1_9TELE|nr:hypothetical protein EYF80_065677 [Liparis tanakae]
MPPGRLFVSAMPRGFSFLLRSKRSQMLTCLRLSALSSSSANWHAAFEGMAVALSHRAGPQASSHHGVMKLVVSQHGAGPGLQNQIQ